MRKKYLASIFEDLSVSVEEIIPENVSEMCDNKCQGSYTVSLFFKGQL